MRLLTRKHTDGAIILIDMATRFNSRHMHAHGTRPAPQRTRGAAGRAHADAASSAIASHAPSAAASGTPAAGRKRMMSIEVLRLLAIVCIAIFHAFLQQYVQAIWMGPHYTVSMAEPVSALASSRGAMWIVAMIMYCGAWGNHIFFMISGFFLIPRMCGAACAASESAAGSVVGSGGYWKTQLRATGRRAAMILATVVFYLLLVEAITHWVLPKIGHEQSASSAGLLYELEFIWLYLVFVALAPAIAWGMARLGVRRSVVVVGAALVAVCALNVYVACTWQSRYGQRTLLDWRKQMSAVSYALSFVLAGLLGWALRRSGSRGAHGRRHAARHADRRPLWTARGFWLCGVVVLLVLAAALTAIMVMRPTYVALYALSFKSTSLISFALAVCALMAAACSPPRPRTRANGRAESAITVLASGILGFYVVQTLAGFLWKAVNVRFLDPLLVHAASLQAGSAAMFWGLVAWIAVGAVLSLAYVVAICLFDRCVRRPLMRAVRLSK